MSLFLVFVLGGCCVLLFYPRPNISTERNLEQHIQKLTWQVIEKNLEIDALKKQVCYLGGSKIQW